MKNKAFTLIELLAVIIILAIIMVIAVPQVLNMIEKTRENAYKLSAELMRKSAETYIASGRKEIGVDGTVVTLDELVSNGFIKPIKDVKDKSTECIGYVLVEIENGKAIYTPSLKCGTNYVSENYDPVIAGEEAPKPKNANVHLESVPDGYTGVYTIEDLNNIRNNLSGKYILMNNLDFNSDSSYTTPANKTTYTTGTGWTTIGNNVNVFSGQFNGNNYIIKNLYFNNSSSLYAGLFGYINSSAVIEKLGIVNANVTGGTSYAGILAGYSYGSNVSNCFTSGIINSPGTYVGGLLGYVNTSINNTYSSANVTGKDYVGGLLGYISYGTVNNSFATGNVTATATSASYAKLIGTSYYGTVNNSYVNISSTATGTGTTNSTGTAISLPYFKTELFINYVLNWDVQNIWDVSEYALPGLGGTTLVPTNTAVTQITTVEDLFSVRKNLTGIYTLMNDLDFNSDSSYRNLNNKLAVTTEQGWIPIGSNNFTGTFNGNGHVIKNLYVNTSIGNGGLFLTTTGATIEKLGLENVNVTGYGYSGGLSASAGVSPSIIRNVYVTGSVRSTNSYAGGLFGYVYESNTLNSYSTANVTGKDFAGGLVGMHSYGSITNSFATGNVTTTVASGASFGRITGYNGYTSYTNCYYDNSSTLTGTGTIVNVGILSLSSYFKSEMFINYTLGWDTKNIWNATANAYPVLGGNQDAITNAVYQITKIEDLYSIRKDLSGTYSLMNDLDFNSDSSYRNPNNKIAMTTGQGWIPIGSNNFTGTFNGNGHIIKNLYINSLNGVAGLFSTPEGSTIEKLGLENVDITGYGYSGGLAGSIGVSTSTIKNIYVTGSVRSTNSYAGGLFGYGYSANVSNTYSTANVTGYIYAGGLIGAQSYGSISNSFATGNVTTTQASGAYFGRFTGYSGGYASKTNCYYDNSSTLTGTGTIVTVGTSSTTANIQPLTLTGLNTWDTSTIWKVNSGSYPTLR